MNDARPAGCVNTIAVGAVLNQSYGILGVVIYVKGQVKIGACMDSCPNVNEVETRDRNDCSVA